MNKVCFFREVSESVRLGSWFAGSVCRGKCENRMRIGFGVQDEVEEGAAWLVCGRDCVELVAVFVAAEGEGMSLVDCMKDGKKDDAGV